MQEIQISMREGTLLVCGESKLVRSGNTFISMREVQISMREVQISIQEVQISMQWEFLY